MLPEIEMYLQFISDEIDEIVGALDGLDRDALLWQPLPTGNCLLVIAKHSLANFERNVLSTFAGEPYDWNRPEEFHIETETAAGIAAAWAGLKARAQKALETIPEESLTAPRDHPNMGRVTGRAVLLRAMWHASMHNGEASLTRGLALAR